LVKPLFMKTTSRLSLVATVAAFAVLLAGCGGGTGGANNPLASTNFGYIRFVNGSADAGTVDFYVDGGNKNTEAYAGASNYVKVSTGQHTIAVDVSGTQTAIAGIPTAALTQSVNGNTYVDLILIGEEHPTVATDTINVIANVNTPYSTPGGGFAVNFHNAAGVTGQTGSMFGVTSSTGTQQLGATMNVDGLTQPVGVPSTFIAPTMTVKFTATSANATTAAVTLNPSQIDPTGCAANTLPCNSGNLSLYYIDGPAASTSPTAGPYNFGITASQATAFSGIFDANST
jgi:hypothetical protein